MGDGSVRQGTENMEVDMSDMTGIDWGIFGSSVALGIAASIWWHHWD